MMTRRASGFTLASGLLPLLVMVAGCGSPESAASRSAAAYDEAQRKGVAVGESSTGAKGGHGDAGHGVQASPESATTTPAMPSMDHSATGAKARGPVSGTDHHSSMPGMKPSRRGATEPRPMAGMDHSGMPGMSAPPQTRTDPHAGMDHSKMPAMSHDMPMSPSPEPQSATATPGQPSATLQSDPLDQPPATSVADARRSAAMAAEMSGGGHGMSHGTYQHVDAGRDAEVVPSPKPSPKTTEHKH